MIRIIWEASVCGHGSKSSVRVYDGAVALMLALMSCFSILPTTPFSHRIEVVRLVKSRRNSDELGLHAVRIGGATTLAAGGDIQKKMMQREVRWKSAAYKACTRNKIMDYRRESRKLVMTTARKVRQQGEASGGNK